MAHVTVQGEVPDSSGPTRLDLTSDPSIHMVLDGAWWPRTRDSTSELVGLVNALDARHAAVGLIMLNPFGWLGRPRRIHIANRTVRIAWIADLDPMVVIGTAAQNRRIDLLLMVPSVEDDGDDADAVGSLRVSIAAMTQALAGAENEPPGVWVEGVRAALLRLYADFRETGFYRQILVTTPRLSNAAAQLNRERSDVDVLFDRALAHLAEPASTIPADRIRTQILAVLQQLTRYQQHGSNLMHEADQVDLRGRG